MSVPLPQLPQMSIDREEAEQRLKSLTSREREVAQKITDGLTNKEIGLALQISARTVETHRQHIFGKLQIRDAVDLVHIVAMARRAPEPAVSFVDTTPVASIGRIAVPDILFRNCYSPKPVNNVVNVLMSWGPNGQPIGFVMTPAGSEGDNGEYKVRSLESAILTALGTCLRDGIPLAIVGDRAVWNEWLQTR